MILIDAQDAVVGRLAAYVAKRLIEGEKVTVINAEKAVISGNTEQITSVYYKRRGMTQKANPEFALKWPRRPDLLMRRIITGMLPKHSNRKMTALKSLKVHLGSPAEMQGNAIKPVKTSDKLARNFITLQVLCKNLGWEFKS